MSLSTPTTLDSTLFGVVPHLDVLSRLLLLQNTNGRHAVAHTKSRNARRGSTRKLYKQKGTGNARAGSSRSPTRRGGWVAFGPKSNANFVISMNATERRLGLASALTLKAQANQIRVLSKLEKKTADMTKILADVLTNSTALIFVASTELTKIAGLGNIHGTHVDVVTHASPAEILKYDFCVFTDAAFAELSTHFSDKN